MSSLASTGNTTEELHMQHIVNQRQIARGERIGKIATLVGLGFLVAGLIVSLFLRAPSILWLSFLFLVLGLVVSSVGTMNMNRWVREPRADQALAQGLKGFDDRYVLYSYYLPAPHVLLSPAGLYVLSAMGQDGVIRYDGDKFRRDFSAGRLLRFMAEEGLGKPFSEAASQVQALQQTLDAQEASEGVEIQNILVFYNPRAELVLSDTSQPVVNTKGLKKMIRKQQRSDESEPLSNAQYRELRELFDQAVGE
jgi:hypothetical protein